MSYHFAREYTPSPPHYSHSYSPPHKEFYDPSTVDRIVDLEDSQRKYEELVQENLWLKDQIDRKRSGHVVEVHPVYYQHIPRGMPVGGDRTKRHDIMGDDRAKQVSVIEIGETAEAAAKTVKLHQENIEL